MHVAGAHNENKRAYINLSSLLLFLGSHTPPLSSGNSTLVASGGADKMLKL